MNNVNPEVLREVEEVLDMASRNKYSTSKVYAAYNAVTGKKDNPQTCSSCLRNRVKVLKDWYERAQTELKGPAEATAEVLKRQPDDPTAPNSKGDGLPGGVLYQADTRKEIFDVMVSPDPVAPEVLEKLGITEIQIGTPQDEEGPGLVDVIRLHVEALDTPVYFEPGTKDPNKGKAYFEGGGTIKPGKYVTSEDRELAVQPGGKATLKPLDNDLL